MHKEASTYMIQEADARLDLNGLRRRRWIHIQRDINVDLGLVRHTVHTSTSNVRHGNARVADRRRRAWPSWPSITCTSTHTRVRIALS